MELNTTPGERAQYTEDAKIIEHGMRSHSGKAHLKDFPFIRLGLLAQDVNTLLDLVRQQAGENCQGCGDNWPLKYETLHLSMGVEMECQSPEEIRALLATQQPKPGGKA